MRGQHEEELAVAAQHENCRRRVVFERLLVEHAERRVVDGDRVRGVARRAHGELVWGRAGDQLLDARSTSHQLGASHASEAVEAMQNWLCIDNHHSSNNNTFMKIIGNY